jgi:hypothetical protein
MPNTSRLKSLMTLIKSERYAIGQLIVHEVHQPHCVDRLRHRQCLGLRSVHTLVPLDPQTQLQLPIALVQPFMVIAKTFCVTQIQEAETKAPVPSILRQPQQPRGDLGVRCIELGLIVISTLAQSERLASQADAQTSFLNRSSDHLVSASRPYCFSARASATISALICASIYRAS